MSETGDILHMLERSRPFILQMLERRGYNTDNYQQYSEHEIRTMFRTNQCDIVVKHRDSNSKTFVFYQIYQRLRNTTFRSFLEDMKEENNIQPDHMIIVLLKEKINPSLQKVAEDFYAETECFVQLFWIKNLMFDVTNHIKVPKHNLMTEDEFQTEVAEKYQVSKSDLQLILRNDPQAKYLGMKPGQVCRITRPSETNGTYLNYRVCR